MNNIEKIEKYVDGQLVESTETILTLEDLLQLETNKYINRKKEGELYFLKIIADLRLQKLSNTITEETFDLIEEALIPVRNEIVLGQWKTGLKKLALINPISIGESLYNQLYSFITEYIFNNY